MPKISRTILSTIVVTLISYAGIVDLRAQTANVHIRGVLKNFDNQCEVEDMSAIGRISLPKQERFFVPDSSGRFAISFFCPQPGYYRIGRNIIYLQPGDSIHAELDFLKPEAAWFGGSDDEANRYLRHTPFPKAGSYATIDSLIGPTIEACIANFISYGRHREGSLLCHAQLPETFIDLEKARIQADIINSIIGLFWYFPEAHHYNEDSTRAFQQRYGASIPNLIAPFTAGFVNDQYLQLVVYQHIAPYILKQNSKDSLSSSYQRIQDWLQASDTYADLISPGSAIDSVQFNKVMTTLQSTRYRQCLQEIWDSRKANGDGHIAADFIAITPDNKKMRLSALRGKIILLDFWATWCGPCIRQFPKLKQLQQHYSADSNVAIVLVSIDEDKIKWQNAISKHNLQEPNWLTDRANLTSYQLLAIPRFIIIDHNFRIASYSGLENSSSKELIQYVDVLRKKMLPN